jgi:hypothetical protein
MLAKSAAMGVMRVRRSAPAANIPKPRQMSTAPSRVNAAAYPVARKTRPSTNRRVDVDRQSFAFTISDRVQLVYGDGEAGALVGDHVSVHRRYLSYVLLIPPKLAALMNIFCPRWCDSMPLALVSGDH